MKVSDAKFYAYAVVEDAEASGVILHKIFSSDELASRYVVSQNNGWLSVERYEVETSVDVYEQESRQAIRTAALAKLTEQEKKVLGIG